MTMIMGAVILGDSMIYNVLPTGVESFGVSVGLVGVLLSANRIVRFVSNTVAAWVLERFGIIVPLSVSILIAIGTSATYGLARGFAILVVARVFWGIAFSVFRLSGYLVTIEETQDSNRGRIMGFYTSGARTGSIIGVLVGGLLFDLAGKTVSFLAVAAFGLLAIPAVIVLARDLKRKGSEPGRRQPHELRTHTGGGEPDTPPIEVTRQNWLWNLLVSPMPELTRFQRRQILTACVTYFAFHTVMSGVLVGSMGYFLSQKLPDGLTVAGVAIGIATLNGVIISTRWASGLAAPYFGYLGDRYGREKVVIAAIPICLVSLMLLAFPGSLLATVLFLPFAFAATGASITALDATVGGLAPPNRRATVMSRYATWQDVGSAIGPLVAYAALGFTSLTLVYIGGAVLMVGALVVFASVFARSGRRAAMEARSTTQ
jgi:MFS family permease